MDYIGRMVPGVRFPDGLSGKKYKGDFMDDFYCGADVIIHDNVGGGKGYIVDIAGDLIIVRNENDETDSIYNASDLSLWDEENSSFSSLSDTYSYYGVSQKDFF